MGGEGGVWGRKGGSRGKGGEMTQTLYAHTNKRKKKRNVTMKYPVELS
jgi:hypothetical protein